METNIRHIRRQQHMTLKDLAEKTGLTDAYLSMIERGRREPTLATLFKIAKALGVTAESLWTETVYDSAAEKDSGSVLVRKQNRHTKVLYPGVEYASLTINELVGGRNRGLIGHFGRLLPGADSNPDSRSARHDEDEFTYIIRGSMVAELAEERLLLEAGDSLVIRKGTPHRFLNESEEPVEYILVRAVP